MNIDETDSFNWQGSRGTAGVKKLLQEQIEERLHIVVNLSGPDSGVSDNELRLRLQRAKGILDALELINSFGLTTQQTQQTQQTYGRTNSK